MKAVQGRPVKAQEKRRRVMYVLVLLTVLLSLPLCKPSDEHTI